MEGIPVVRKEDVLETCDIFVTATGNKDIIMAADMAKMKNNAIVSNIGHFDNEIDMAGLAKVEGIKKVNIKPQTDRWVFPDGHGVIVLAEGRLMNLGCATGHPSFVMSCSFTNQTLAQVDLWKHKDDGYYKKEVRVLPKELDEEVARLHLEHLGARLTKLSNDQASYIDVNVEGQYKPDHYRYYEDEIWSIHQTLGETFHFSSRVCSHETLLKPRRNRATKFSQRLLSEEIGWVFTFRKRVVYSII